MKSMRFTFKVTPDLLKIVEHSSKNPCTVAYTREPTEPSLFLVKDMGVYLMSASTVKQPVKETGCLVVYADGYTPDDGYIGGDDFVENIPISWFNTKKKTITIDVSNDSIKLIK